jgi:SNF2 family DNA or RNA helicase
MDCNFAEERSSEVEELVSYMLKPIMLRRTKRNIPDLFKANNMEMKNVKIEMSEDQRQEYQKVESQLTKTYKELVERGELKNNMIHIFAIVSKLRQICDHKYAFI